MRFSLTSRTGRFCLSLAILVAASCVDRADSPTGVSRIPAVERHHDASDTAIDLACTASRITGSVACSEPAAANPAGSQAVIIGDQNTSVKLTSSNVSYDSGTGIFQFDVTVQNLMNEAIGTPDGTVADPDGIQVFFGGSPKVTVGSGIITVANADGTGTFTSSHQPYYAYHQILAKDAVSSARTWQLHMPPTVESFSFKVKIETDVQYLLVINEVMVNPPASANPSNPANPDATAEWFEVYNAGTRSVEMQNLFIVDSAASGRRPYHLISSSLNVPSGGYVVLGNSTNTSQNGGVNVNYSYGSALALANSLDAVKIARVYGTDTLTIDRTQFAQASISAKDGITRELKNPALDNSNMDGSNWGDALVTSVFGTGGRGTPGSQNSTFTPRMTPVAGPGPSPLKRTRPQTPPPRTPALK
jgi:hypothetical protein